MIKSGVSKMLSEPLSSIWPEELKGQVNSYIEFRQEFELTDSLAGAELVISCDSNYAVWVNGVFVDCGQYSYYPDRHIFDVLVIGESLRRGKNAIAVLVHHHGRTNFSYLKGQPGLMFQIHAGQSRIGSGPGTLCRPSRAYRQGTMPLTTPQLSYTFEYDARGDDGWTGLNYASDADWRAIRESEVVLVDSKDLSPRPLEKLILEPRPCARIISQGVFERRSDPAKSVAEQMQEDFLSFHSYEEITEPKSVSTMSGSERISIQPQRLGANQGIYLVVDLGREEAGLLDLELEACSGTIIDIAYGEHLDDLRVRAFVGGRNFASRYICRQGRQQFTHYFARWAGRFVQMHIHGPMEPFHLYYAGLRPTEYPVKIGGSYQSADHLQNKTYDVSVRTLHLCMHEHYEDCPWREQALYANDSRNQMLAGYYCFSDYSFAAQSISLLGKGLKDDGYLEMCAPSEIEITIPSFTMVWFQSVIDHWLYSGDREAMERHYAIIKRMLDIHLGRLVEGLLPCPVGQRYWQFYDWAQGLMGLECKDMRFDAPLNLFFCLALEASARLALACGEKTNARKYQQHACELRRAFHDRFWDPSRGAYVTYRGSKAVDHVAELTQSLAILAGACPNEVSDQIRRRLAIANNGWVATTLSQSLYKFQALLTDPDRYGKTVQDTMEQYWSEMVYAGATSFWETLRGGWDFDRAGSLCHGWSAIPIYFYGAFQLGIEPIEPGFQTFKVNPVRSMITQVSGKIPTPAGPIEVHWEWFRDQLYGQVNHPAMLKAELARLGPKDQVVIRTY